MVSVWLIATLDTKGDEAEWLRAQLIELGLEVILVDAGCMGTCKLFPDVDRDEVFANAKTTVAAAAKGDRGAAVDAAAEGVAKLMQGAQRRGEVDGIISLGGSAGTTIGTAAMRALPFGIPKVMVSTLASGPVRQYVQDKDIVMMNSVVDIAGINRISRVVLANAAAAIAGMVQTPLPAEEKEKPLVAATMFGVTTPCVEHARGVLEEAGYEVLVFHATGNGGQALESLIRDGVLSGVLDMTTTELADELVGGVLSAGPERLTAAAAAGLPQVVSVGATDMVNFLGSDTVPDTFRDRELHVHNANVTLMRTTAAENTAIGEEIGCKLAEAQHATVLLPLHGVSSIDKEDQPFDDPVARKALFKAIRENCGATPCIELRQHINDPEFGRHAAETLLRLMQANQE